MAATSSNQIDNVVPALALRERYRDDYWHEHDPILADRLLWRAHTFRHTVHLMPGESILELGCGSGDFSEALVKVTRGENPITAVTFQDKTALNRSFPEKVEILHLGQLPGKLSGRQFDYIVAMDLLDRGSSSGLLAVVHELLAAGGEMVFYESNPWNPVRKLRGALLHLTGKRDPRNLLDRPRLYELLSELGFIRIYAVFNDFVFAPLTRPLIWCLRNLSILLENAPLIRRTAGSILVHAQKHPPRKMRPTVSLCVHESLRGAISVVIPCHNEEMNIGPLVEGLLQLYGEYISEIILVDDGSTDGTAEVMARWSEDDHRIKPLHRQAPNGVGLAIRDGLAAAKGAWVFSMDCDFQHLLPEFREMFDAAVKGYDIVIGSRFSRHSVLLNYPFGKIFANRAFHTVAILLFARRFRDVTNNLKLMRHEVVQALRLRQPGFAVNAEAGLEPLLLGYRMAQVPISWINRTPEMGTSSFRLLRVGGGYWEVLSGLWLGWVFRIGPYRDLFPSKRSPRKEQVKEESAATR